MNVQSKTTERSTRKNERLSQEVLLKKSMEEYKKGLGDRVLVRIDDRTLIELPASMSEIDRQERIKNYLKNSNFRPIKGLL